MKKLFIIMLAAITAVLFASCGEEEKPAAKNDGVVIQITSREAAGNDDEVKIKEETVQVKGKKSSQTTEPTDSTEPTTKTKKKKKKKNNVPTQGDVVPGTHVQVTTAPNGSFSDADLIFVYKGSNIRLNDDIETAEKVLGDDIGADELAKNKTEYDFNGVTIITYQSGENEKIEQITVTADTIATKKGAKVGMYGTQLRTVYGVPTKKSETAYVYSKGNMSLTFNLQNNVVASYTYNLKH